MAEPIITAQDALKMVADYYKTTVPEITRIMNQYGADTTNVKDILAILIDDGATAYDLIYNADGSARTLIYDNVTDWLNSGASQTLNAMYQINSNATATAVSEKVKLSAPVQAALDAAGAATTFKVGATAAKTGALATVVTNPISAAVAGVGAGVALGVGIDAAIYKLNPHFWTDLGFTDVDPAKYPELVDPAGLFTGLFKTDATAGTSQMYIDQEAFAYLAKYLNSKGAFDSSSVVSKVTFDSKLFYGSEDAVNRLLPLAVASPEALFITSTDGADNFTWFNFAVSDNSSPVYLIGTYNVDKYDGQYYAISANNFTLTYNWTYSGTTHTSSKTPTQARTKDGTSFYQYRLILSGKNDIFTPDLKNDFSGYTDIDVDDRLSDEFNLLTHGTITTTTPVEGITTQPDGKTPNISKDDTVDAVLSKLKEQYPGLFDDALTVSTPQPDGTFKTYTYVPVGSAVANGRTDTQPTNTTQTQTDTSVNVNTSPKDLVDTIISSITSKPTKTDVNNGTNTGSGGTPAVPPVTGKASALYTIYNPTLEQINSLGAWLWSSNFIDQLLKLFASPMDAIIGLHKVYATPATGAAQNIKVGYLDSGVPSKVVTEQYTTIDCGTINCYEYFGNVLDYNPYTNLRLYLPFIGIIELSNSDVMRSSINVVYHVDVLTGACLAEVKITRDGGGGTLYQYAGNACTTLPISSGSYMGVISSVSSVATRALAGFASGGALGAVASGATGVLNAQGTNVVHSGGFSGNAGAMGCKKPYLIVERPQTETADNTAKLLGYGSNLFVQLKTCKGLTKVKGVHVDAVPATKEEKKLIEEKLIDGVIINQ